MAGYTCYKLTDTAHTQLITTFPPKYEKIICEHITDKFNVEATEPVEDADSVTIIGHADSGDGIECLVVKINGSSTRADGATYHITLSLNPEQYKPYQSNELLKNGFSEVDPIEVSVAPMFYNFETSEFQPATLA